MPMTSLERNPSFLQRHEIFPAQASVAMAKVTVDFYRVHCQWMMCPTAVLRPHTIQSGI